MLRYHEHGIYCRFRCITKQYFRKADGIILMYDVTSEQSFLNVRNWITSVKAGVDEGCVMCLVGNKVLVHYYKRCDCIITDIFSQTSTLELK